jgi:serine/threonine protein kinase
VLLSLASRSECSEKPKAQSNVPANCTCEECGGILPANAPQGLCPRCLAGVGLSLLSPAPPSHSDIERGEVMIGRYRLLQKIGEGGFGVVFMAEQVEPLQRKVALKIIKAGMDTGEVIARFEAERQALALMDHPNIARALDAGATEAGRPYFVMELIHGIPITEYSDQECLPTAGRLQLFIRVCQAVQHAHEKGLIHRDLKPSNVLVTVQDGQPVPKVIDFGVAKALGQKLTDRTFFTASHHLIGTPAYMSPEQAALTGLDIDTRSDVYSLGVLLYELLTGTTPFEPGTLQQAGLDEFRQMIMEAEPPKPSTRLRTLAEKLPGIATQRGTAPAELQRLVRGDLDWIVLRCLEKDPERRYASANELAADGARHLANQPVTARAPSPTYRFQKLVRRNRLAFTAAIVIGVLLLLLSLGGLIAGFRLDKAHQIEIASRKRAEFRENLTKAESLCVQHKFEEADRLMGEVHSPPEPRDTKDGAALFRNLAEFFARRGRWREAAVDLKKAMDLQPDQMVDWISKATLFLANRDQEGYRDLRRAMLPHFPAIKDPNHAQRVAKVCLLLPLSGSDFAAREFADLALNSKSNTWRDYTKGLAEYRQGRYTSAVHWAEQVMARPRSATPTAYDMLYVQDCMLLAMAHQQSGQTNDARSALDKGLTTVESKLPKLKSAELGPYWVDWVAVQVLMAEAKSLIQGTQPDANDLK